MSVVTSEPCNNRRPGEPGPCGRPNDGRPSAPGYPTCAECRAAANAIGRAAVALLVERAAQIEASRKAA